MCARLTISCSGNKLWGEFLRNYFILNASRLLDTVRAWAKSNKEIIGYAAPDPENPYLPAQVATGGLQLGSGDWITGRGDGARNLLKELEASLEKYVGGSSEEGQ